MNARNSRSPAAGPASRVQSALIHRGPGAMAATRSLTPTFHAPNAALLIDFDNVTMGIRSDLGKELRTLLSSDIIKGKVAVQRAYADWRRYVQYIVPLSEASIDLIFAPAYGSSKKNATDIRLAIDALELVFTRPEIGTFILLSGDSDFSSLVIKLKEYGKYVIGVGIRESSSDLLVQNCDEYYSYNALAGLVKASEDMPARKFDPWELVSEAVTRMKTNGDVMRSDRLKQVMQEIDPSFDEKNLGMSKFSRFVQEASQRGLLSVTKLENGQLEIGLPPATPRTEPRSEPSEQIEAAPEAVPAEGRAREERPREERGRRGRRGRGRGREREERARPEAPARSDVAAPLALAEEPAGAPAGSEAVGLSGERLTRNEAFDLVRRAVETLTTDDNDATRASDVRRRAREILGRDSESLSDRMFIRILKDAHDAGIVDLRRRGDDFEVARAPEVPSVVEQLARADSTFAASTPSSPATPRLGMGHRGVGGRGRPRLEAPPPELLAVGIVEEPVVTPRVPEPEPEPEHPATAGEPISGAGSRSGRGGRKRGRTAAKKATETAIAAAPVTVVAEPEANGTTAAPAAKRARGRAATKTRGQRGRAKKAASKGSEE